MRVITHHLLGHPLASAAVGVRVGWRHEPPDLQGITHFLEHVHYLGSMRYPDIDAATARYGVGIDGPTLTEGTIFSFTALREDFLHLVPVLPDMVYHPRFAPKAVERERKVILGSVNEGSDYLPWEWARLKTDDLLFQTDELSSLGNHETISRIQLADLQAWQRRFYHAGNSFLIVAGDLETMQPQIEEILIGADIPRNREQPEPVYHDYGTQFYHRPDKLSHPELYVAFRFPSSMVNWALLEILRILLGNYPYSLLWSLRQDDPVAYMVESGVRILSDAGRFGIYVGIINPKSVPHAWGRLVDLLAEIKERGVTEEKLSWAKRVSRLELLQQAADPQRAMAFIWRWALWNEDFPGFAALKEDLERVTPARLQEFARDLFRADNCFISLVGPAGRWELMKGLARLA